jgi:hypothetical protein
MLRVVLTVGVDDISHRAKLDFGCGRYSRAGATRCGRTRSATSPVHSGISRTPTTWLLDTAVRLSGRLCIGCGIGVVRFSHCDASTVLEPLYEGGVIECSEEKVTAIRGTPGKEDAENEAGLNRSCSG